MSSYQYKKYHSGDKTVVNNGISYTGRITSLYWIGALVIDGNFHYTAMENNYVEGNASIYEPKLYPWIQLEVDLITIGIRAPSARSHRPLPC